MRPLDRSIHIAAIHGGVNVPPLSLPELHYAAASSEKAPGEQGCRCAASRAQHLDFHRAAARRAGGARPAGRRGAGQRQANGFRPSSRHVPVRGDDRAHQDGPLASDPSANRAFDGLGKTRDFYDKILGRNSIDDHGMRLDGYVHRGRNYNNAFWDGQHMVFGDGDGVIFTDFTGSLDVIGHELTHGVTEFAAGLEYHTQSGALNESVSDVFGAVVKQWSLKQTADKADWLIGAESSPDHQG